MHLTRTLARVVSIIAISIAIVPAAPAGASHTRLQELRQQERATRARLATALVKDAEVRAVLGRVTTRLNREQAALNAAKATITKIELRMRAEQRRLERLEARADQRAKIIAGRAAALYMMGPVTGTQMMSGSESMSDVVARAGALEFVMRFDKVVLEELARIEDQTNKTRATLKAERTEMSKVKARMQERVDAVAELVATQRAAHNKLAGSISAARAQIAALDREQSRIQSIIVSRSSASSGGSVSTGGASASGYAWPIRGRITSGYGPRWGSFHTGIDIDCRTGDGIGASKGGRVIASEYGGGYGQMIIIDHGGGMSTLYAHMSRLYVGRGAQVSQGQRIGACGSTGNSTGDHLHFEVRVNGQHRNPMNYLP